MKFETTPSFDSDYRRLKREHADAFKQAIPEKFAPACGAFAKDPNPAWPASLRVKSVHSAPGVLEMTRSFASPDGRATFEMITVDGELRCAVGAASVITRSSRSRDGGQAPYLPANPGCPQFGWHVVPWMMR